MWVSRRRWRGLRATAAKATDAMFERDQLRAEVEWLRRENHMRLGWLRQAQNPGDVRELTRWLDDYKPREYGTGDLDACAGEIKEAA